MKRREDVIRGLKEILQTSMNRRSVYLIGGLLRETEARIRDAIVLLEAQEPRLLTAEDFESNPNVDNDGNLPCWVECNEKETASAIKAGIIVAGESIDGWTETDVKSMPGQEYHNPNVRYWTGRPSAEQMAAVKWNP